MLTDTLKLANKPMSVRGEAAYSQTTPDHTLNTGFFSQLPAFELKSPGQIRQRGATNLSAESSTVKSESSSLPAGKMNLP